MSAGHFPAAFKDAFITPALKKPGLDVTNVQSYRVPPRESGSRLRLDPLSRGGTCHSFAPKTTVRRRRTTGPRTAPHRLAYHSEPAVYS